LSKMHRMPKTDADHVKTDNSNLDHPINVLLIPDGNRRAAKRTNRGFEEIYRLAARIAHESVLYFFSKPFIRTYAIFGLSYDNLARNTEDVKPILQAQQELYKDLTRSHVYSKKGIRVSFVGELDKTPVEYQEAARKLERETVSGNKQFYALIGYDGQREILRAHERLRHSRKTATSEQDFFGFLDIKHPIDLVIRTGGEKRISGAPLFQSKYAEFVVLEQYFPFCREDDWAKSLNEFNNRETRHGK